MSEFRRRLMMQRKQSLLPDELQACEYIQSSGTQRLSIRCNYSIDDVIDFKFKYVDFVTGFNNYNAIFGVRYFEVATGNNVFWIGYQGNTIPNYMYLRLGGNSVNYQIGLLDIDTIHIDKISCKINGVETGAIMSNYTSEQVQNFPQLFCMLNYRYTGDRKFEGFSAGRLYYFNKQNQLQSKSRNMQPCYVKSGQTFQDIKGNTCPAGTIGMYDTVNGDFYTNDGSGTFTKGADI